MGSPHTKASKAQDSDHIPDVNLREEKKEDFHVGRGGAGNAIHEEGKAHTHEDGKTHESLIDKIKDKLHK